MINYKEVFQVAQGKGFSSCIDDQRTPDYLKLAEVQKWLRDEHKIIVETQFKHDLKRNEMFTWHLRGKITANSKPLDGFTSYEETLLNGINETLKLI